MLDKEFLLRDRGKRIARNNFFSKEHVRAEIARHRDIDTSHVSQLQSNFFRRFRRSAISVAFTARL